MRQRACWALGFLLTAVPQPAAGQFVSLSPIRLEVGVRGQSTWEADARGLTGEQWLGIGLEGAILDPRLVSFTATVTPSLLQNRLDGGFGSGNSNGRRLGLDLQAHLLRGRPVWGSVRIARFTFDERGYGLYEGESNTRNALVDATLRWDNPLMPLRLGFHRERWGRGGGDVFGFAAPPSSFETLELAGANRKTSFSLRQQINRNGAPFTTRLADFQNRQTWGKGSSLQVSVAGSDQADSAGRGTSQVLLSGGLHLQHLRTVASDWSVFRQSTSADAFGSTSLGLTGGLTWAFRPGMAVGFTGTRTTVDFDEGAERSYRLGPNTGLAFNLPLGARLFTSGTLQYQRHWSDVATDARVTVASERHLVDPAGAFLLDQPNVDLTTIVVRSTDGIVYTLGFDYEVVATGGFVQILTVPSGRVTPGQTLLVDYQYRPVDRPDVPSWWVQYSADLQFKGLRAYHRRWLIDPQGTFEPEVLTGRVYHLDHRTTGVQLTFPSRSLTGVLRAERQHRTDDVFQVDLSTVGASLTARVTPRLSAIAGGDYSVTEGTTGRLQQISARAQLDWLPAPTLSLAGGLTSWRAIENRAERRTRFGGTVQAIWTPGLLRAALYYAYLDWSFRSLQDLTVPATLGQPQHRLTLELSRRF